MPAGIFLLSLLQHVCVSFVSFTDRFPKRPSDITASFLPEKHLLTFSNIDFDTETAQRLNSLVSSLFLLIG